MKYVYECSFIDKPECERCMLSFTKMSYNDETRKFCAALGIKPKCPDKGCRKDCPLKKVD